MDFISILISTFIIFILGTGSALTYIFGGYAGTLLVDKKYKKSIIITSAMICSVIILNSFYSLSELPLDYFYIWRVCFLAISSFYIMSTDKITPHVKKFIPEENAGKRIKISVNVALVLNIIFYITYLISQGA
jgi:hypothetical protein